MHDRLNFGITFDLNMVDKCSNIVCLQPPLDGSGRLWGLEVKHSNSVGGSELFLDLAGRGLGCICGLDEFVNSNLKTRKGFL